MEACHDRGAGHATDNVNDNYEDEVVTTAQYRWQTWLGGRLADMSPVALQGLLLRRPHTATCSGPVRSMCKCVVFLDASMI
jgi:hypothetical protein